MLPLECRAYGESEVLRLAGGKSAGISLIQDLQRAHIPVIAYDPGRADRIRRLSIVANIIKAGRVWVPESDNRKGYVKDWAEGCVSQGLRYMRDGGWISIDAPPRDDYDDDDVFDADEHNGRARAMTNPYSD